MYPGFGQDITRLKYFHHVTKYYVKALFGGRKFAAVGVCGKSGFNCTIWILFFFFLIVTGAA